MQTLIQACIICLTFVLLQACGSGSRSESIPEKTTSTSPYAGLTADIKNGIYLFNFNCAGCHGNLAQGSFGPNIQGKQPADIRNALKTVPNMARLAGLNNQELVDIASHLATLKPSSSKQPSSKQSASASSRSVELSNNTLHSKEPYSVTNLLPVSGLPEYAEVSVSDVAGLILTYQQHSPQKPITQLQLAVGSSGTSAVNYPLQITVTNPLTLQQQTRRIWTPTALDFSKP